MERQSHPHFFKSSTSTNLKTLSWDQHRKRMNRASIWFKKNRRYSVIIKKWMILSIQGRRATSRCRVITSHWFPWHPASKIELLKHRQTKTNCRKSKKMKRLKCYSQVRQRVALSNRFRVIQCRLKTVLLLSKKGQISLNSWLVAGWGCHRGSMRSAARLHLILSNFAVSALWISLRSRYRSIKKQSRSKKPKRNDSWEEQLH